MSDKSLQNNSPQTNQAEKKTDHSSKKQPKNTPQYATTQIREALPSGQTPLPSNPKHRPVKKSNAATPYQARQRPIEAKNSPVIKGNPIANLLQAIGLFFVGKVDVNKVNTQLHHFYLDFMAYMRPEGTPTKALRTYLYNLETSVGKQGGDPRLSHELELLNDYLQQLTQKYPYPQYMLGHYATQLRAYIATYQNRFGNPQAEKQMRGYRQVFVGQQSGRVLRIGYDATAGLHQVYLIDEAEDKVIEQMSAAAENQPMIQDMFVGQKLEIGSIFNEITDWTKKPGIQGVVTPKESQIKGYKDVPFGIELAVSVLTPVGVMNSAYKLGTGKDLMHPEKKTISKWEKSFAVADLVLILPLGKILKVPGKIALKLGKGSDEAAALLNTGKKVGDDFVVEVAQNSKYAEKFLKAEAKLAARQAKKAEAVKKADQAYQKYKDLQRAKYARKVAKGMDGALYIKIFPGVDVELAAQAVNMMFLELKTQSISFQLFLDTLKAKKTWKHLVQQAEAGGAKVAADDELYDLYAALNKIKSDDDLHKQMHQALMNGDKQKAADLISNNNYKSGLGSAVLKFEKVAYSEANDLVQRAINFRKSLGARGGGKTHHSTSGSNVAVFEYIDKSGNIAYKEAIATGRDINHAEKIIMRELANDGIPSGNVTRIYSELDSCMTCTKLLDDFKQAKGFYSFELNDVGRRLWVNAIKQIIGN